MSRNGKVLACGLLAAAGMFIALGHQEAEAGADDTGFVERFLKGPKGMKGGKSKYVVFVPHSFKKDAERTYPVIVFLHGSGERGTDGWAPTNVGLGNAIRATEKKFPFIAVFPQAREWFEAGSADDKRAMAMLDDAIKTYRGDPNRVCLTGWSLGGLGTWELAAAHPERWSAIVPVCTGAAAPDPKQAAKIKDIPCWCFHGAKDDAAPIKNTRMMVKALEAAGGSPKFTVDPQAGHTYGYVNGVYANKELQNWMLKQKRK